MASTRGWEKGGGNYYAMGTKFQCGNMKNSGNEWC